MRHMHSKQPSGQSGRVVKAVKRRIQLRLRQSRIAYLAAHTKAGQHNGYLVAVEVREGGQHLNQVQTLFVASITLLHKQQAEAGCHNPTLNRSTAAAQSADQDKHQHRPAHGPRAPPC